LFCAKEIKTPCILDLLSHFFEEKVDGMCKKSEKKEVYMGI
jgi:hypothetical protein